MFRTPHIAYTSLFFGHSNKQHGFTVLELVTVLVVMAFILAGMMGVTLYSTLRATQVVNAAEINLSFQTTMRYITNEVKYSFPIFEPSIRRSTITTLNEDGISRRFFLVDATTIDSLYVHPTYAMDNYNNPDTNNHAPHSQEELDQMPRLLSRVQNVCVTYRDADAPLSDFGTGHDSRAMKAIEGDALLRIPQVLDIAIYSYVQGSPRKLGAMDKPDRICIQERVLLEPTARYGLSRVPKVYRYSLGDNKKGEVQVIDDYVDLCEMALKRNICFATPNF